jgi:hypothetical protein
MMQYIPVIRQFRPLRERRPPAIRPIYTPAPHELIPLAQRAKRAFGDQAPLVDRAVHLISQGHLEFSSKAGWICRSAGHPAQIYHVSRATCTCPYFSTGGSVLQGRRFCKHKIALLTYEQVLLRHLNQRLAGNTRFGHERAFAQAAPHARLILVDNTGRIATYPDHNQAPQAVCRIGYSRRGLIFATERDIYRFAHWLAQDARPLPVGTADAAAQALALYTHLKAMGCDSESAADAADAVVGHELSFEEWRTHQ